MNCPECGLESRVIESRLMTDRSLKRRRECSEGHRFTTYERVETPESEYISKELKVVSQTVKGFETRLARIESMFNIDALNGNGKKHLAVAIKP